MAEFETPFHPGERLRQLLADRGWTQDTLASVTGRSRATINAIVAGKSGVSADMAVVLAEVFGVEASEWLRLDADYQLSLISTTQTGEVSRKARIFSIAPVRDMQKRGWIRATDDLAELESELEKFFGTALTDSVPFPVATRRSVELSHLSLAEKAWCFRARQLARVIVPTGAFSRERIAVVEKKLRRLAAFPKEAGKLSETLLANGIRFVVVEPLPGAKIDGAAFWLDESSPVIAVSIRHDRIDAFWFTVMHEFAHLKHGDLISTDANLLREDGVVNVPLAQDAAETKANDEAANILVPKAELDSFVRRLRPHYSSDRVVQFAHRVRMHPGVIVGQLQRRGEVGYSSLRDFLVKVRPMVTTTAMTDGWGQEISPNLI